MRELIRLLLTTPENEDYSQITVYNEPVLIKRQYWSIEHVNDRLSFQFSFKVFGFWSHGLILEFAFNLNNKFEIYAISFNGLYDFFKSSETWYRVVELVVEEVSFEDWAVILSNSQPSDVEVLRQFLQRLPCAN